ncbi:MAG TPA: hypothetical protein VMT35_07495 [Ignavibacteriaceae bacterium]|nr:hypothetical protein [Ignavibacteriaceae bacterium]
MNPKKIYRIILLTSCGTIGSISIGLIFFGTSVFTPGLNFQFAAAGLYGSFFFSLLEFKFLREQIFAAIFILILQLVVFSGKYISFAYAVRDIFYLAGLFLSIKVYHLFIKKNNQLKLFLRVFALSFFYGLINLVFISVVFLINAEFIFPPLGFIYVVGRNAVLIGFGIGLGIDFYFQYKNQLFSLLKIRTT